MADIYSYPLLEIPEIEEETKDDLLQGIDLNLLDNNEEDNYEY